MVLKKLFKKIEERRLERLVKRIEEREGNYLEVYQATEGEYNSNPCIRVSFQYNGMPSVWIKVGDQSKVVERDVDELKTKQYARTLEDLSDIGQLVELKGHSSYVIEELLKKRKYQEFREFIKGEFEDNKTYVVFAEISHLTSRQVRIVKRFLSKFRKRLDWRCSSMGLISLPSS